MKWFLQFLSIGSVVIYTFLIIIDKRIADSAVENAIVSEAQSNQRRLSAWGPNLPNRSLGQDRRASLTTQQNEALALTPYRQSPRQYFDHQPASEDKLTASEMPAHPVSPGTNYHESIWVAVLLPARVHTGPSVDTPVTHFYAVGTPLHATRHWNDWIEVIEPGASKSGWIYRKYLGAISNSEQGQIASREAQEQSPVVQPVPAKRYAKASPAKRYANSIRSSKQSTRVKPVTARPIRGRTEMASLLQRAFSGY